MITVTVLINGQPIYARTAVNIGHSDDGTYSSYELDNEQIIEHKREDGAIALAVAMLKTIKEPGGCG